MQSVTRMTILKQVTTAQKPSKWHSGKGARELRTRGLAFWQAADLVAGSKGGPLLRMLMQRLSVGWPVRWLWQGENPGLGSSSRSTGAVTSGWSFAQMVNNRRFAHSLHTLGKRQHQIDVQSSYTLETVCVGLHFSTTRGRGNYNHSLGLSSFYIAC